MNMKIFASISLLLVFLAGSSLAGIREISDVKVLSIGPCDSAGWVDIELEITTNNEGWKLDVVGAGGLTPFVYGTAPARVVHRAFATGGLQQFTVRPSSSKSAKLIVFDPSVAFDVQVPLCPQACAITEVEWIGFTACGTDGLAEAVLDLHTRAPAAAGDRVRVKLANETSFYSLETVLTANPTRVSVPFIADGRSNATVVVEHDNTACTFTNRFPPGPLPNCANPCGIRSVTTLVSACDTNDEVEVVTQFEVTPPFSNALISVRLDSNTGDPDIKTVRSGIMTFTNVTVGTGSQVRLQIAFEDVPADGRTLTPHERLSAFVCDIDDRLVQLPLCICEITELTADIRPCENGAIPVDLTIHFRDPPVGGFVDISAGFGLSSGTTALLADFSTRVPVQTSPQQVRVFLPSDLGSITILTELGRTVFDPQRVSVTNPDGRVYRAQCSKQVDLSISQTCPEQACDLSGLRLTSISPCEDGLTEVTLECDVGTTHNPLGSVLFTASLDTGDSTVTRTRSVTPGTSTTARIAFQFSQSGNLTFAMQDRSGGCAQQIGPFAITCSNRCEIVRLVPTGMSPCLAGGRVDVQFELETRGIQGSWFCIDHRVSDWISRRSWVFVDQPVMPLSINVRARGGILEEFEIKQVRVENGTTVYNPDCSATYNNLLSIRDCFAVPDVCLLQPPRIFATRIDLPPPGFSSTYLNLMVDAPEGVEVDLEGADELDGAWAEVGVADNQVDGKPALRIELDGANQRQFYRVRCEEVAVPVP